MAHPAKPSRDAFSSTLRSLLADRPLSRPFVCDGSPLDCQVMLVGFNAATSMQASFLDFWTDQNGFGFNAWQQAYTAERQANGKTAYSATRRNLNRLQMAVTASNLSAAKILETNIFDHPSANKKQLLKAQQDTQIFDFLLHSVQPRIVISHGKDANQYLATRYQQQVNQDHWVELTHQGQTFCWYATSHLSRGWSYEKLDALGQQIAEKSN
ncbi:MAG: hypothetical protein WA154_07495 [Moraxellaceae bacterium]